MSKPNSSHACSRKLCTCAHVTELTSLYRELKRQRKLAAAIATRQRNARERSSCRDATSLEFRITAEEKMETDASASLTEEMRRQRGTMQEMMGAMREMNEELARSEEEIRQTETEIADLQNEVCTIEKKFNQHKCGAYVTRRKKQQIEIDEAIWRESVTLEIQERNCLQKKIKRMADCLETLKLEEKSKEEKRQEERKMDNKLLLDAVQYVDKFVKEYAALVSK